MRKTTIATAVIGTVATLLTSAGPVTAATRYDARAELTGHRTCVKSAGEAITRRTLVLDNTRSERRVQYKVVRDGDRFADPVVYRWVPAHRKKKLTVSVPQRTTASVRVRVPEMGRNHLRLSRTVAALASCKITTFEPKASLGGVRCTGADSVAQIVLDNRSTTDDAVSYRVTSSYGASSASFTVRPASATNHYLPVPAGRSTQIEVRAAGRDLLSIDVGAVSCPS
ncbi:MAG: hypothetical protein WBP61_14445 [Nocardioides sp.]